MAGNSISSTNPLGHLIGNDDLRNFVISQADAVAKLYGWRV